jgi:hypothetical protein
MNVNWISFLYFISFNRWHSLSLIWFSSFSISFVCVTIAIDCKSRMEWKQFV